MRTLLLASTAVLALAANAAAENSSEADVNVETITIIGLKGDAREVAGSATLLPSEVLQVQDYTDIGRVLRQVPGVNIQEEDGYGLRPNIGLRGTGLDRSANIVLMEDGILAAPAPYSAAAAYYSPYVGRMAGVEIVKGASGVRYGPRTQGGSVNFLSTPVPESWSGRLAITAGEEEARRIHAYAGGMTEVSQGVRLGGLVEAYTDSAEGFKTIDFNAGQSTGFDLTDFGARLRAEFDGAGVTHAVELRYQTSDETSDETYMGLTDADFAADPYRRYAASANDQINVDQSRWVLRYDAAFDNGLNFTVLGYRNEVARNWFKVEGVNAGAGRRSLGAVLSDPVTYSAEYAILTGQPGLVSIDGAVISRNNNRSYVAEGVQAELVGDAALFGASHRWRVGVRAHRDSEDRFQNEVFYRMDNSQLIQTGAQTPGFHDNRVVEAEALAIFVQDEISFGALTLVPGLRYERIEGTQTRWAATDQTRSGATTVTGSTTDVFIPGLGVRYQLNDSVMLFGGVHRGFAPSSPSSSSDPEDAVNWEAGVRWSGGSAFVEAVGFFNDYSNLIGTCTASTGGGCTIGAQFDGGEVDVRGLELSAGVDLAAFAGWSGVSVPVRGAYTWTDAEFQTAFASGYSPWGSVQAGDKLPYLPEHQWFASIGLEQGRFGSQLAVTWNGERRTVAGQGAIPAAQFLDSYAVADLAVWYDLTEALRARVQVRNLTDEVYAASRSPAGLRPGAPRAVLFGLSANF
ncbi:TonB-dependent receptor family protein [Glycocaulis sp.]|uniref:TonB-dependent receptor family protein n=1 Tax=Glycocaulis sp. TaxID=1969725 RepID=UPI003F72FDEF